MPTTINHGVNLPTVGGDFDEWGTENNAAHEAWDALTSGPQNTVLGRVASGSGPMTQLTSAQLTTIPNAVVGDSGSGGTKGMVPAPAAGDAAANKVLLASGSWGHVGARGVFNGLTGATVKAVGLSCVYNSAGDYDFTLSPAMPDADYVVTVTAASLGALVAVVDPANKTTAGFTVYVKDDTGTLTDAVQLNVSVLA